MSIVFGIGKRADVLLTFHYSNLCGCMKQRVVYVEDV